MLVKRMCLIRIINEIVFTLKRIIQKSKIGICKEKIINDKKHIFANKIAERKLRELSKTSRACASCSAVNILPMHSAATNSMIAHRQPICTSGRLITCVPKENGNKISRQSAKIRVPSQKDFLTQKERKLILFTKIKVLNQRSELEFGFVCVVVINFYYSFFLHWAFVIPW